MKQSIQAMENQNKLLAQQLANKTEWQLKAEKKRRKKDKKAYKRRLTEAGRIQENFISVATLQALRDNQCL